MGNTNASFKIISSPDAKTLSPYNQDQLEKLDRHMPGTWNFAKQQQYRLDNTPLHRNHPKFLCSNVLDELHFLVKWIKGFLKKFQANNPDMYIMIDTSHRAPDSLMDEIYEYVPFVFVGHGHRVNNTNDMFYWGSVVEEPRLKINLEKYDVKNMKDDRFWLNLGLSPQFVQSFYDPTLDKNTPLARKVAFLTYHLKTFIKNIATAKASLESGFLQEPLDIPGRRRGRHYHCRRLHQ